jgi:cytochrome P450
LISISIIGVHRNPAIWSNPNSFDPDRWNEDRIKQIPDLRHSFIPFLIGSRDCIGKVFAQKEARLLSSMIIRKYKIEFADDFVFKTQTGITSKPIHLKLKFTGRSEFSKFT